MLKVLIVDDDRLARKGLITVMPRPEPFNCFSFNEYIRDIRIRKAKKYLEYSQRSISDISTAVGYDDEKYFSRVFKKATGKSPGEYRKECR